MVDIGYIVLRFSPPAGSNPPRPFISPPSEDLVLQPVSVAAHQYSVRLIWIRGSSYCSLEVSSFSPLCGATLPVAI